jgi:NAD(P)H dehydrogenase (quinone)
MLEAVLKVLVVYAHPNPQSFNHAILDAFLEGLSKAGHESDVMDLYSMDFDPCLAVEDFVRIRSGSNSEDVLSLQARINKADVLVVIHPNWWGGVPAILKGWIDRVFSLGYAYAFDQESGTLQGLLDIKKSIIISTCGSSEEFSLCMDAFHDTWSQKILQFCGIPEVDFKIFYDVINVDDVTRNEYLKETRTLAMQI